MINFNNIKEALNKLLEKNPTVEQFIKDNFPQRTPKTDFLSKAPACASLAKTKVPTNEHIRACIMELIRAVNSMSKEEVITTPIPQRGKNDPNPNKDIEKLKDKIRTLIEDAVW